MSTRGGLGEEGIVILDNGNDMSVKLIQGDGREEVRYIPISLR